MKKILVTAIGGDIGQSVAQCLKSYYDDIFLIGTDVHDKHAGSLYVDKFLIVPSAHSPAYLKALSKIIEKNGIDLVIPINEIELKVLANGVHNLNLIQCDSDITNTCLDKLATMDYLRSLGLDVPWTVDADNEPARAFPCIIKPRFGSGSRQVFVVNSEDEADIFSRKYTESIFQELLDPFEQELTCGLYRTNDGQMKSIQFERLLVGGLTGWARVVKDSRVDKLLNIIASGTGLNGSINVQLRITERGAMVFEINPRFSSTAYMRHKLGFIDVIWSVKEFFSEPVTLTNVEENITLVRKQDVMIMSV